MTDSSSFAVIVPTLNAAATWVAFLRGLEAQGLAREQVLIVDSASPDGTAEMAKRAGLRVEGIARSEFNHGGTRQWATQFFPDAEIFVYLTQDAILAGHDDLRKLVAAFEDATVGAAFGRQLPRRGAGPIEAHGRWFNYTGKSNLRSLESRKQLGFKAIFISNSLAAYRRSALEAVGGFPDNVILGEDTVTAARLLLKGWKIAYIAEAQVYHSHDYSVWQEFKRYFDTGVLHAREPWLVREFGGTGSEGKRFVLSELKFLLPVHVALIPSALVRTAAKLAGYRIGRNEGAWSTGMKRRLSMHRGFWK